MRVWPSKSRPRTGQLRSARLRRSIEVRLRGEGRLDARLVRPAPPTIETAGAHRLLERVTRRVAGLPPERLLELRVRHDPGIDYEVQVAGRHLAETKPPHHRRKGPVRPARR